MREQFEDRTAAPIILALGHKGSGKSFRIMTLIKHLLDHDLYDRYLLFLPSYAFEAKGSYTWLKAYSKKVFIAPEFTPEISKAFLARTDEKMKPGEVPRTFLWLDDAGVNTSLYSDRDFLGLLSIARHKRLSIVMCYHSLSSGKTLNPFVRQNCTHCFLFRITNRALLEQIWDEVVSMSPLWSSFKTFCIEYNNHTSSHLVEGKVVRNHAAICIDTSLGLLDWGLGTTWLIKETQFMKIFTTHMERLLKRNLLPAPGKDQMAQATSKEASSLKSTVKIWKKGVPTPDTTPSPLSLTSPKGGVVESEPTPKKPKTT